jgi:hypothetical protein
LSLSDGCRIARAIMGDCAAARASAFSGAAQPVVELIRLENNRHPVVYFGDERVRFRDDHGAGRDSLAGLAIFPLVPQARSGDDRRTIARGEVAGLLAAGRSVPFVEAALPLEDIIVCVLIVIIRAFLVAYDRLRLVATDVSA